MLRVYFLFYISFDFGSLILYVMICLLFALEISHSTIKCILTRSVTRLELILSKYLTALVMIAVTLFIFWSVALGAAWYYYGLGDLTENEYVIFEASYMLGKIAVGSLLLLIPMAAMAAMALAVSTFSSTCTTNGSRVIHGRPAARSSK